MIYLPIPREAIGMLRDFGWTIAEISKEIGASGSTVSRIASGYQRPNRDTAQKIMALSEAEAKRIRAIKERLDTFYKD